MFIGHVLLGLAGVIGAVDASYYNSKVNCQCLTRSRFPSTVSRSITAYCSSYLHIKPCLRTSTKTKIVSVTSTSIKTASPRTTVSETDTVSVTVTLNPATVTTTSISTLSSDSTITQSTTITSTSTVTTISVPVQCNVISLPTTVKKRSNYSTRPGPLKSYTGKALSSACSCYHIKTPTSTAVKTVTKTSTFVKTSTTTSVVGTVLVTTVTVTATPSPNTVTVVSTTTVGTTGTTTTTQTVLATQTTNAKHFGLGAIKDPLNPLDIQYALVSVASDIDDTGVYFAENDILQTVKFEFESSCNIRSIDGYRLFKYNDNAGPRGVKLSQSTTASGYNPLSCKYNILGGTIQCTADVLQDNFLAGATQIWYLDTAGNTPPLVPFSLVAVPVNDI